MLDGFYGLDRWPAVRRLLDAGEFPVRKTLTDKAAAKLQPRAKTYHEPDPELRGHYVRVQPSGTRTFAVIARNPGPESRSGPPSARPTHSASRGAQAGADRPRPYPRRPTGIRAPGSILRSRGAGLAKRHVAAKRLRSEKQITRLLELHVFHFWRADRSSRSGAATSPRCSMTSRTITAHDRPMPC